MIHDRAGPGRWFKTFAILNSSLTSPVTGSPPGPGERGCSPGTVVKRHTGMNKNMKAGTLKRPEEMTEYEVHLMARSRVVGRTVKQHVPVKYAAGYDTETGKLGEDCCSISKQVAINNR
jgi:hypothetical protein